jgi:adenylosuccinate synthase
MSKGTLFGKPRDEVIKRPGALTAKAKKAKKSISEFCAKKHTGTTAKQCGLAKAFKTMRKGK